MAHCVVVDGVGEIPRLGDGPRGFLHEKKG